MADLVQGRPLNVLRNEDNLVRKALKNHASRPAGTRTALSNISNVQRRPNLGSKAKKEILPVEEKPIKKTLGRATCRSNLLSKQPQPEQKSTKDTLPLHIQTEQCEFPMEEMSDAFSEQLLLEVEDIDEDDMGNPTLCAEYVKDIYTYMHKLEQKLCPSDYMHHQPEINKKMRSILIDWLIQVQSRFSLLQETLYLTVYLIDRFLDKCDVNRSELQLVGVTAMLLASKYEEMYAPEIGDFVYITDNAYSKIKIRSMEQKMLKACDFDFSNPLCLHFLRRNSKAGSVDAQKHTLAKFLMELTLVEYNLVVKKLPSEIAAAALFLSIKLIDDSVWTETLVHYSGYSETDLLPVVAELSKLVLTLDTSKYQAVKSKYAASKFLKISRLPELKGHVVKQFAEVAENKN